MHGCGWKLALGTITSLEPGTEFIVCHDPTLLTCLVVTKGEVEVVAQGKVVAGQRGRQRPTSSKAKPLSADLRLPDQVNAWINDKLGKRRLAAAGRVGG